MSRLKVPFRYLRNRLALHRQCRSIESHKSRLPRKKAKNFAKYLSLCQKAFKENRQPEQWVLDARDEFLGSGFTSIQQFPADEIALKLLERIKNKEKSDPNFWGENERCQHSIHKMFPEVFMVFNEVIEPFLQSIYQSHCKIFYGILARH